VAPVSARSGRGSAGLLQLLDLERIDDLYFRGRSLPTASTRVFGGEVAAQSLVAAGRTVPGERQVHSLHTYFLRPGDPAIPTLYRVDPIRDGGSFTTRRVVAIQRGEPIFHLSASFQTPESGPSHQIPTLVAPDPDALPPSSTTMAASGDATRDWFAGVSGWFPFEMLFPEDLPRMATVRGDAAPPRQRFWLRAAEALPDDPLVHVCAMTYASDMLLLSSALPPHRLLIGQPGLQFASLDHAIWFHAPFRTDDWLFCEQEGFWAGGARALCRGTLFDRNGVLVATIMQEGLIRLRDGNQSRQAAEPHNASS
jgi:acyl-CoA thioesterase-2